MAAYKTFLTERIFYICFLPPLILLAQLKVFNRKLLLILKPLAMLYILFFLRFFITDASCQTTNFKAQIMDSSVSIGYGLAIGDVDGDKKPDILLADKKQFVWYRNGDWKKFVMIENLTEHDNVCIAAHDIDGDGKVEVAVGAQWNPGETSDDQKSGSVHFLLRPADPTKTWTAIKLFHQTTIHRMRWLKSSNGNFYLVVLPLHGKDNKSGTGTPVNLLVYQYPDLLRKSDPAYIINTNQHLTHNFELPSSTGSGKKQVYVAGKEGFTFIDPAFGDGNKVNTLALRDFAGAGEIRSGNAGPGKTFITTIEPMHGNNLVVYSEKLDRRELLDTTLNEGHALAAADLLGLGYDQIVAGWRKPAKDGKVGIKLYRKTSSSRWEQEWVDENGMACEDLQVQDLNGDGRLDIIAAGRATQNLKVYWNQTRGKNNK